MKTKNSKDSEDKQLTELSEEELKQVTGGAGIDCSLPENMDLSVCTTRDVAHLSVSRGPDPFDFQVLTLGD